MKGPEMTLTKIAVGTGGVLGARIDALSAERGATTHISEYTRCKPTLRTMIGLFGI
jgi:hypothetical protein